VRPGILEVAQARKVFNEVHAERVIAKRRERLAASFPSSPKPIQLRRPGWKSSLAEADATKIP
jgi:hypothetical protein